MIKKKKKNSKTKTYSCIFKTKKQPFEDRTHALLKIHGLKIYFFVFFF